MDTNISYINNHNPFLENMYSYFITTIARTGNGTTTTSLEKEKKIK